MKTKVAVAAAVAATAVAVYHPVITLLLSFPGLSGGPHQKYKKYVLLKY